MRNGNTTAMRLTNFFRRAGWWGTGIFAIALFFAVGGLISLLDGDFRIVLQSLFVAGLLGLITYYLVYRAK